MTPQESQALQTLLSQLVEVRGIEKDPEADALIRRAVAQQPDAAYLLAQRSLILEQAVEAAKQRIAALERQSSLPAASSAGSRSFLDANAWGRSSASTAGSPVPGYPAHASEYGRHGVPGKQGGFLQGRSPGMFGGGGGSFLGTMAATAAGVAGGAFLFQGLGNLLDGDDSPQADSSAATDGAPDQAADAQANSLVDEPGATDNIASTEDYAADDSFADDGGLGDDSSFG